MEPIRNMTFDHLVNFHDHSTCAENEFYTATTEDPESLAFRIRDGVFVRYNIGQIERFATGTIEPAGEEGLENAESAIRYYL